MTNVQVVKLRLKVSLLIALATIYILISKAWNWCRETVFILRVARWIFPDLYQLGRIYRFDTNHPDYQRGMAYAIIREGRKRNEELAVSLGNKLLADLNEPLQ
jgi:hypothetical protein